MFDFSIGNGQKPSASYKYLGADGALIGYMCRYEMDGQKKEYRPWVLVGEKWVQRGFEKPRPLYGLQLLANSDHIIMMVEGEKCADALATTATKYLPIAWPNGANAVNDVDFSPLKGRSVVLWPDRDDPGRTAMGVASEKLLRLGCSVKIIDPGPGNDGWDVADAINSGWDWAQIVEWAKPRVKALSIQEISTISPVPRPPKKISKPNQSIQVLIPTEEGQENTEIGVIAAWDRMKLSRTNNGEGRPHMNGANIARLLEYRKFPVWYDVFSGNYKTSIDWGANYDQGRERMWDPLRDAVYLRNWVQLQPGFEMTSRESIRDGWEKYCQDHMRNEPQEWMLGLKWDGERRLGTWLHRHLGVRKDKYHEDVGKSVVRSMVARVLHPGCQVHSMLTLISKEGWGKSTVARILGEPWYASIGTSWDKDRDMAQKVRGLMVAELAENESSTKATVEAMKRMVTTNIDRVIEKYQNLPTDIVRSNIFIVTSNVSEILDDNTGYRRNLPVTLVHPANLEELAAERDQLVAEAVVDIKAGETWHIVSGAHEEAVKYRVTDPWDERIFEIVEMHGKGHPLTISDVMASMNLPIGQQTMQAKRRIGSSLRLCGCAPRIVRLGATTHQVFIVPDKDFVDKGQLT
jgi:hypothetical protein